LPYSDLYSDTYDTDPAVNAIIQPRAELLMNGAWTDISSYVYQRDPVAITRGRPDEASQVNPAVADFTVNNRDGRFSLRNPLGAYYGLIGKNTPLRLSMGAGSVYLRMEDDNVSSVSAPDTAGLSITGSIDIRIDMRLTQYWSSMLAAKYLSTGNERSWYILSQSDGTILFRHTTDGTLSTAHDARSTVAIPYAGRFVLRVTLNTTSGDVTFYTAPGGTTTWTQLGDVIAGSGSTSIFDSTAPVAIGYGPGIGSSIQGRVYSFTMLSGIGGTAKASPDFTAQTAGAGSFTDAQSNTWTMNGTAELSDRDYRFHGEMASWPARWDSTGSDVYVNAEASGVLRRVGQGSSPLNSAMYRSLVRETGTIAPVAYWPCEDMTGATSIASALGGPAMKISGKPQLASDTSFACSDALPGLQNATLIGAVPTYSGPSAIVRFLLAVGPAGTTNGAVICRIQTTGTIKTLDLVYNSGGGMTLHGYDSDGGSLFTSSTGPFGLNGINVRVSVELRPDGSGLSWAVATLQTGAGAAVSIGNTVADSTIGRVTKVTINPSTTIANAAIGHISVQPLWESLTTLLDPLNAWTGETAGNRFHRLCLEESIDGRLIGPPDDSVAMGVQGIQTLAALLQECETADQGMLFEPRQALSLGYRTRASLLNQDAAVVLDYTAAQLAGDLEPEDDDQRTINDVTVSNADGSSSRQVQETGTLSVLAPPDGVGRYDTQVTENLASDGQLGDAAGWRLHLGTVDEPRYPVITEELARPEVAAILADIQAADIGDRVQVANTPAWLPPGGIDQLAAGFTETIGTFLFTAGQNTIPASPYDIGIVEDAVFGHADTDESRLHLGCSSTATAISVTVVSGPLWTTDSAEMPFDVTVGGEEMTVTAISGSGPQTFTVTRAVNGVAKAHSAGDDLSLAHPAIVSI